MHACKKKKGNETHFVICKNKKSNLRENVNLSTQILRFIDGHGN